MIFDIIAYIIIFIAFAYPFYNIYKIIFLKKKLGCAACNRDCQLKNISNLNPIHTIETDKF
ncbi:MAG: hypothetical protein DRJ01_08800 [Bacteroidetes bacterium]|nr:MAG: hypothetical protein DRJ01_08800 [Bacteroidota bacterium]